MPNARLQLQVLLGTWNSGTPDARLPPRASSTCKVVGGNPQPLRNEEPCARRHLAACKDHARPVKPSESAPGAHSGKLSEGLEQTRPCPPWAECSTQEETSQGSAFAALARTDHCTRLLAGFICNARSLNIDFLVACLCAATGQTHCSANTDPCEAAHPTPSNRVRRAWLAQASTCPCWRVCQQTRPG